MSLTVDNLPLRKNRVIWKVDLFSLLRLIFKYDKYSECNIDVIKAAIISHIKQEPKPIGRILAGVTEKNLMHALITEFPNVHILPKKNIVKHLRLLPQDDYRTIEIKRTIIEREVDLLTRSTASSQISPRPSRPGSQSTFDDFELMNFNLNSEFECGSQKITPLENIKPTASSSSMSAHMLSLKNLEAIEHFKDERIDKWFDNENQTNPAKLAEIISVDYKTVLADKKMALDSISHRDIDQEKLEDQFPEVENRPNQLPELIISEVDQKQKYELPLPLDTETPLTSLEHFNDSYVHPGDAASRSFSSSETVMEDDVFDEEFVAITEEKVESATSWSAENKQKLHMISSEKIMEDFAVINSDIKTGEQLKLNSVHNEIYNLLGEEQEGKNRKENDVSPKSEELGDGHAKHMDSTIVNAEYTTPWKTRFADKVSDDVKQSQNSTNEVKENVTMNLTECVEDPKVSDNKQVGGDGLSRKERAERRDRNYTKAEKSCKVDDVTADKALRIPEDVTAKIYLTRTRNDKEDLAKLKEVRDGRGGTEVSYLTHSLGETNLGSDKVTHKYKTDVVTQLYYFALFGVTVIALFSLYSL